jgi:hypothetical protein
MVRCRLVAFVKRLFTNCILDLRLVNYLRKRPIPTVRRLMAVNLI